MKHPIKLSVSEGDWRSRCLRECHPALYGRVLNAASNSMNKVTFLLAGRTAPVRGWGVSGFSATESLNSRRIVCGQSQHQGRSCLLQAVGLSVPHFQLTAKVQICVLNRQLSQGDGLRCRKLGRVLLALEEDFP